MLVNKLQTARSMTRTSGPFLRLQPRFTRRQFLQSFNSQKNIICRLIKKENFHAKRELEVNANRQRIQQVKQTKKPRPGKLLPRRSQPCVKPLYYCTGAQAPEKRVLVQQLLDPNILPECPSPKLDLDSLRLYLQTREL